MSPQDKSTLYASWVWILAAASLYIYGLLILLNLDIPGIEQLLIFLSSMQNWQIYLAAFLAIFIEGLYFLGSFLPGSAVVVLFAIVSQDGGAVSFLLTITAIFAGWCLAGLANIYLAQTYKKFVNVKDPETEERAKDHVWTTWFPAFRANCEVEQTIKGADTWDVFMSGVRVKFIASLLAASITLIIPHLIDLSEISNEESVWSIFVVATITMIVGITKIRKCHQN